MGLSIGALILFIANIATFVKQHFFDSQAEAEHAFVVSEINRGGVVHFEGTVGKHAWRLHQLDDGNQSWAITSDLDSELERLERELARLEESLGMEEVEKALHVFEVHRSEPSRHGVEARARRARQMVERLVARGEGRRHRVIARSFSGEKSELQVHVAEDEQEVHIEEIEGQNGRKSYRVVVRSTDNNR